MNRPIARAPIAHGIGSVLRVLFRGLHAVRRPRPIHTRGVMLTGHVEWVRPATAERPSGIAWVDAPPPARRSPVVARLSRSIGLPAPLPDIIGLAVRVETDDGDADIEFASTGTSVPLRFALLPHRRPSRARFGILLPYRGTHGPVLLRARTLGPPLPSGAPSSTALSRRTPGASVCSTRRRSGRGIPSRSSRCGARATRPTPGASTRAGASSPGPAPMPGSGPSASPRTTSCSATTRTDRLAARPAHLAGACSADRRTQGPCRDFLDPVD